MKLRGIFAALRANPSLYRHKRGFAMLKKFALAAAVSASLFISSAWASPDSQVAAAKKILASEHPDYAAAAKLLKAPASSGNCEAQLELCRLNAKGLGVPENRLEASRLCRLAALSGLPEAM